MPRKKKEATKEKDSKEPSGSSLPKNVSLGLKALDKQLEKLNKAHYDELNKQGVPEKYHKPVISRGSEFTSHPLETCGSGSIDRLLGKEEHGEAIRYGWRNGRVYTFYGPEHAGKSTVAYQMAGYQQSRKHHLVIIVDTEGRFTMEYGAKCGMVPELTYIIQAHSSSEESFDKTIRTIEQTATIEALTIGVIVFDSLQAPKPKAELLDKTEKKLKSTKDNHAVGTAAKKNNQFLGMILPLVGRYDCKLLVIGQARENMDSGSLPQLSGGKGVRHYSEAIIRVNRVDYANWPKVGDKFIGHRSRFTVEKAPGIGHGTSVDLPYYLGKGFDESEKTIDLAIEEGVIQQAGAWYGVELSSDLIEIATGFTKVKEVDGVLKIQGREKLNEVFTDQRLYKWLLEQLGHEIQTTDE